MRLQQTRSAPSPPVGEGWGRGVTANRYSSPPHPVLPTGGRDVVARVFGNFETRVAE